MTFFSKNKFDEKYLNKISAKYKKYNMESYLTGDVRFNNEITPIDSSERANDFLVELQKIMDLYGVVKVDISIDIYKYLSIKNKTYQNK